MLLAVWFRCDLAVVCRTTIPQLALLGMRASIAERLLVGLDVRFSRHVNRRPIGTFGTPGPAVAPSLVFAYGILLDYNKS